MKDCSDKEYINNIRNAPLISLAEQIQNSNIKNYILNRIIPQMEWYSDKGKNCKNCYYGWMTVSIILGALIPVVSVFADGSMGIKVLLAVLGASVTACNAYIALHNYRNLWLNYRNTRESLQRILYYYFNSAGIFVQCRTQEEKDVLLVNVCEEEMNNEAKEWLEFNK